MLPADTQVHRLSYEDVMQMVEAGVLREDDRVELVDGLLVDMTPPSSEHSAIVAWLTRHFAPHIGDRELRVQDLLLVEGGFLMPDLMVIEPIPRDRHPTTALLVIEVAITTGRQDAWKAVRYAGAGVDEYWIVDVPARELVVHHDARVQGYDRRLRYGDGDRVETPVGAPPVKVGELLGPPR